MMSKAGKAFREAVRDGKVAGFSAGPDFPDYDDMEIDSPAGTRVRFTGKGGHEAEQKRAQEVLTVDAIYTVERTDVGDWHTDVYLKEFPGKSFNSVMFAAE